MLNSFIYAPKHFKICDCLYSIYAIQAGVPALVSYLRICCRAEVDGKKLFTEQTIIKLWSFFYEVGLETQCCLPM